MEIKLETASGRTKCRHDACTQNPEYIAKGRIKKGTTCVCIRQGSASGWHYSYYCRDCIDKIHQDVKMILNSKLWAFS